MYVVTVARGTHRRGNDFSVGEQKLLLAKNNQDNQIHNTTSCNMYFSKKVYGVHVQWGLRQSPQLLEFSLFENFWV